MREQQIRIGDRRLNHAATSQAEPPMMMLHGVTRRWQTFLPMWSSLAVRWQLSAMDFRGHGGSDNVQSGYLVSDYAEDVIACIESQIQQPVVLYGHSLGAMVAAQVAAKLGDRIAALIMEDPPMQTMGERIAQTPLLSFFTAMRSLAGDARTVAEIANELAEAIIHDPSQGTNTRLGDLRDRVSLRFTASCLKRLDPAALDPIVKGRWLDGFDTEAIFRNIRCPCLLVQADSRAGGMLTDHDAQLIEEWVSDLVRVTFGGCGHLIHWSQTTALLNHVHGFLESIR